MKKANRQKTGPTPKRDAVRAAKKARRTADLGDLKRSWAKKAE